MNYYPNPRRPARLALDGLSISPVPPLRYAPWLGWQVVAAVAAVAFCAGLALGILLANALALRDTRAAADLATPHSSRVTPP